METLIAVLLATGFGFFFLRKKQTVETAALEHPALVLPPGTVASPPVAPVPALPVSPPMLALSSEYVSRAPVALPPTSAEYLGDKSRATSSCASTPTLIGDKVVFAGVGPCVDPALNPHPNPDAIAVITSSPGYKAPDPIRRKSDDTTFPLLSGVASGMDHQWCINIVDGDTAGRIAEETVGNRDRYIELLSANPDKAQIISPEMNFASLCVGERLFLPRSWNTHIDQKGMPAGKRGPYPPYDKLPPYPTSPINAASMGSIPWPSAPFVPTGWKSIESMIKGV